MLQQWAEQVVRDASDIIGYDVLITDREGNIMAASEAHRVGTLHTPSLKVLRTRQAFHTTPEEAAGMTGVYPGITLPMEHGGRVVGSIAIAGPPEEVGKFGELVRRQAELYLRETTLAESRILLERAVEELVQEVGSTWREPGWPWQFRSSLPFGRWRGRSGSLCCFGSGGFLFKACGSSS
jgi:carbohydrate diacid regulator